MIGLILIATTILGATADNHWDIASRTGSGSEAIFSFTVRGTFDFDLLRGQRRNGEFWYSCYDDSPEGSQITGDHTNIETGVTGEIVFSPSGVGIIGNYYETIVSTGESVLWRVPDKKLRGPSRKLTIEVLWVEEKSKQDKKKIVKTPGATMGATCKDISKLAGLTPQDLCNRCAATGYCKTKYKKNKCECKKLKCKRCKKDYTCCV